LLDAILSQKVMPGQPVTQGPDELAPVLRERLACPVCVAGLEEVGPGLRCRHCGREFEVRQGVPRLCLSSLEGELPTDVRRRWPGFSHEADQVRSMFTAERPKPGRLLCHMLNIELGLLHFCQHIPAPPIDYLNSAHLRQALMIPAARRRLPPDAPAVQPMWWDRRYATEAEIEAMRALGINVMKLRTRVEELSQRTLELSQRNEQLSRQLGRVYSRWPLRLYLWLRRLLRGRSR
jgi:uncharacterized protein YbaR (Trm112 family)